MLPAMQFQTGETGRLQKIMTPEDMRPPDCPKPGLAIRCRFGAVRLVKSPDGWFATPWPQPKSLAAAPLVIIKQALNGNRNPNRFAPS